MTVGGRLLHALAGSDRERSVRVRIRIRVTAALAEICTVLSALVFRIVIFH